MREILLSSDLDRTLMPNGSQPESPRARPLLRSIARRPELKLAYVSGRSRDLIVAGIREYDLPLPDYAIGDVGTTIHEVREGNWIPLEAWSREIGRDWSSRPRRELETLLADIPGLRVQEPEKQSDHKLSYYAPADANTRELTAALRRRLEAAAVRASIVWSVDEVESVGLVDILPERANKLEAIRFLARELSFDRERTVFAGDSGNDLAVLISGLRSILVRNAAEDVRTEALEAVTRKGIRDRLHIAEGNFLGMNGNYAAGVLEGLAHFFPETRAWMAEL